MLRVAMVFAVTFTAVIVTLALADAVGTGWSVATGMAPQTPPAPPEQTETDLWRIARTWLVEAGEDTVTRLVDGRLSLPEAADELDRLGRDRPELDPALATRFPDAPTRRLRLARYCIRMVLWWLSDDPARQAGAGARLEAEYALMSAAP
jgi:hypothetical protein